MSLRKPKQPCGNRNCSCSTTIADNFSFGSGGLDSNGFWDKPCYICARDFDKKNPDMVKKYGPSSPIRKE